MPAREDFYGKECVSFYGSFLRTLTGAQAASERELHSICPWRLITQEAFFKRLETIATDLEDLCKVAEDNGNKALIVRLGLLRGREGECAVKMLRDRIDKLRNLTSSDAPLWLYHYMMEPLLPLVEHMKAGRW